MDRNIMAKVEATWAERLKAQGLGGRNGRATQRLLTAQADFLPVRCRCTMRWPHPTHRMATQCPRPGS